MHQTEMTTRGNFTIAGAGPVGALLAVVLGRRGYKVGVFEARPDSRVTSLYQGKSINIALSDRGWRAMQSIGIDAEIRKDAIAMKRRVIHDERGDLTYQPYGKEGQAIWSVSRGGINERLVSLAEEQPNVSLFFEHKLIGLDFSTATAQFRKSDGGVADVEADYLFGADGAYSKVRRLAHDIPRFSYSQSYMPQCYIELSIPANDDGSHQLEKNALHIWPRKEFMLIALPNPDGTFTCTLFLNFTGTPSFESLGSRDDVEQFFNRYFSDAMPYLEDPVNEFMIKTAAPLFLVHIYPWTIGNKIGLEMKLCELRCRCRSDGGQLDSRQAPQIAARLPQTTQQSVDAVGAGKNQPIVLTQPLKSEINIHPILRRQNLDGGNQDRLCS